MRSQSAPMLFTIDEVAMLLGIDDSQWLRDKVKQGHLEPAVRGGKGRGLSHQFSLPQVFGLSHAFWAAGDLDPEFAKRHSIRAGRTSSFWGYYRRWAEWTEAEVKNCLGLLSDEEDPWTNEVVKKRLGGPDPRLGPADEECLGKLIHRLRGVREAAKVKMSRPDPERLLGVLEERMGMSKAKRKK
jgi:hypothetical protein